MKSSYLLTFYLLFHIFKLQLNSLKDSLKILSDNVASKLPDFHDLLVLIPYPDGIYLQKSLSHYMWTTDTCHVATLVRTISVENFGDGVLQQDCHKHLRNVWVGGLEKELSSYLTNLLISSLDEIDPTLHDNSQILALEFLLINMKHIRRHTSL